MNIRNVLVSLLALTLTVTTTNAYYVSGDISEDTISGVDVIVNHGYWNGGGTEDWTSTGLLIDLTSGSIVNKQWINPFYGGQLEDQDVVTPLAAFVDPEMAIETHVGPEDAFISNNPCDGSLGGGPCGFFDDHLELYWFNTDPGNTGVVKLATIALTTDAFGTWTMQANDILINGLVTEGMMFFPEPTSLALFFLAGPALLRRS